jgi:hypothetical protein
LTLSKVLYSSNSLACKRELPNLSNFFSILTINLSSSSANSLYTSSSDEKSYVFSVWMPYSLYLNFLNEIYLLLTGNFLTACLNPTTPLISICPNLVYLCFKRIDRSSRYSIYISISFFISPKFYFTSIYPT